MSLSIWRFHNFPAYVFEKIKFVLQQNYSYFSILKQDCRNSFHTQMITLMTSYFVNAFAVSRVGCEDLHESNAVSCHRLSNTQWNRRGQDPLEFSIHCFHHRRHTGMFSWDNYWFLTLNKKKMINYTRVREKLLRKGMEHCLYSRPSTLFSSLIHPLINAFSEFHTTRSNHCQRYLQWSWRRKRRLPLSYNIYSTSLV